MPLLPITISDNLHSLIAATNCNSCVGQTEAAQQAVRARSGGLRPQAQVHQVAGEGHRAGAARGGPHPDRGADVPLPRAQPGRPRRAAVQEGEGQVAGAPPPSPRPRLCPLSTSGALIMILCQRHDALCLQSLTGRLECFRPIQNCSCNELVSRSAAAVCRSVTQRCAQCMMGRWHLKVDMVRPRKSVPQLRLRALRVQVQVYDRNVRC